MIFQGPVGIFFHIFAPCKNRTNGHHHIIPAENPAIVAHSTRYEAISSGSAKAQEKVSNPKINSPPHKYILENLGFCIISRNISHLFMLELFSRRISRNILTMSLLVVSKSTSSINDNSRVSIHN
jgi:hypothetical protein